MTSTELLDLVATTFTSIKVTQEECDFLENSTRNQASSWFDYRRGLITASHFHSVLHYSGKTYPASIVKAIMQYIKPNPNIPALKWGKTQEDTARQMYLNHMESHEDIVVHSCGLVINPAYPYLGATPDGIVLCKCCGKGLLEIKCSFKYKDISPVDEVALNDNQYFLRRNPSGEIHFSRSHAYYDQVQGQMLATQSQYCDFVCWTMVGIFVERISFDINYLQHVLQFEEFFKTYLLLELLTHNILSSTSSNSAIPPSSLSTISTCDVSDNAISSSAAGSTNVGTDYIYCFCKKDIGGV